MTKLNPWSFAIPILIFVLILWTFPKSLMNVNPKWIFSEKDTCYALVDSVKVIHGMRGRSFNQRVYYNFEHKGQTYNGFYKATAFNSGSMNQGDKIKIEFIESDPDWHKRLGYIRTRIPTNSFKKLKSVSDQNLKE